jgi:hypothetical protein
MCYDPGFSGEDSNTVRRRGTMRAIITVTLVLCASGGAFRALPDTYTVCPDGTGDFATIQEAIEAADSLDIIELTDGRFTGPGNRNLDFAGKAITLRSRSGNPQTCIIDCQGDAAPPGQARRGFVFRSGEGPGSVLRGITVTGGISGGK